MRFSVLPPAALFCLVVLAQPLSSRIALAQDAGGGPGGLGGGGPGGGGPDGGGPGNGGPGGPGGGPGADGSAKTRLDAVLSVLRDHQSFAGKACLEAMTEVHKTEDQVAGLGQQDQGSTRTDSSADIARDVLDSDYDTAEGACRPDALRACTAQPSDRSCARIGAGIGAGIGGGAGGPPPGP